MKDEPRFEGDRELKVSMGRIFAKVHATRPSDNTGRFVCLTMTDRYPSGGCYTHHLTPSSARELGQWLIEEADKAATK